MTDFKSNALGDDQALAAPQPVAIAVPRGNESSIHEPVLSLTLRLFGRIPTLAVEHDPELGSESIVIAVPASGSVEEIVALNDRWHRELPAAAAERADRYRLAIDTR